MILVSKIMKIKTTIFTNNKILFFFQTACNYTYVTNNFISYNNNKL